MSRIRPSVLIFAVAFATLWGCDKVPLTSPTGSTITLNIDKSAVPIGGTAQLTAVVTEASGTAPQNGTMVTFVAPFGTITPQEAPTVGGTARATFTGTASGVAKVGAFSGAAKATEVEIKVGAAAAEKITLRAEPATLSQNGGTTTIIAVVQDASGTVLPNAAVNFTTDNGTLSTNSQNTDANGEARITLATNRTAKVTATVGSKTSEPLTITALAAPSVTVTGCSTIGVVGVAITCTITPSVAPGGAPIQNLTVNWGDGTGDISLGTVTGPTTASHTYTRADTYTVTGTATDTAGQSGRGTASVTITRSIPSITITGPPTGTVNSPVSFTVTPPSSATGVGTQNVTVDFGDGTTRNLGAITAPTTVSKTYGSAGNYIVAATVTDNAGTRNTASTAIQINNSAGPTVTLTQSGTLSGGCGSFSISMTPAANTTIVSGTVRRDSDGREFYNGTTSATFAACGLAINDILTARVTDSTGTTSTAQLLVK